MWLICTFFVLCALPYWHPANSYSIDDFSRKEVCKYNEANERSYACFKEKVKWADAYSFCRQNGMKLVTIITDEDKSVFSRWYWQRKFEGQMFGDFRPKAFWVSGKRKPGSLEGDDLVWLPEKVPINHKELADYVDFRKGKCLLWEYLEFAVKWSTKPCRDVLSFCCQTICKESDIPLYGTDV